MAEPLKNSFGPDVPKKIAAMIAAVHPAFPSKAFIKEALDGYEALDLLPRGWKIARALRSHLPQDFEKASEILVKSLGVPLEKTENNGMSVFIYLPHVFYVADYGLEHFEAAMRAQHALTQRFTAEFSIRAYLGRFPKETLARLSSWAADPSEHVRRLVSEGTRPRLPWAPRLRAFQADPAPVLALLEKLKDDPSEYVRRSVANNLNDIGKDHPNLLVDVARRWMKGASPERKRLVRHALRSLIKLGDPGALDVLGYGDSAKLIVRKAAVSPKRASIGGKVTVSFEVANVGSKPDRALVDFRVHFVKANGSASPKVFKLTALELAPGASAAVKKSVTLAELTTRKHYAGRHKVEALINGRVEPLGSFDLS